MAEYSDDWGSLRSQSASRSTWNGEQRRFLWPGRFPMGSRRRSQDKRPKARQVGFPTQARNREPGPTVAVLTGITHHPGQLHPQILLLAHPTIPEAPAKLLQLDRFANKAIPTMRPLRHGVIQPYIVHDVHYLRIRIPNHFQSIEKSRDCSLLLPISTRETILLLASRCPRHAHQATN